MRALVVILALGPAAEKVNPSFGLAGLGSDGSGLADQGRLAEMDKALSFVYDEERSAGLGGSAPYIPKWLAGLREFFRQDIVALVQKDAIERKGRYDIVLADGGKEIVRTGVDFGRMR